MPSAANVYLELVYADGRKVVIRSDQSWESTTGLPTGGRSVKTKKHAGVPRL
jgi:hypothetical protein